MWTPSVGAVVDVNGMGSGVVRRVMNDRTVLVFIDAYQLEIELGWDAVQPKSPPEPTIEPNPPSRQTTPNEGADMDGQQAPPAEDPLLNRINNLIGVGSRPPLQPQPAPPVSPPQPSPPRPPTGSPGPIPVPPRVPLDPSHPPAQLPQELMSARKSLESLRFGLVPHGHIEQMTLGYDSLAKWTMSGFERLAQGQPVIHKVIGPFGTGKSHTMAVIRHLAKREGYLVARAEVDGQHISLSEPQRLFHALSSTIEGRQFETDTPLSALYQLAIASPWTASILERPGMAGAKGNLATIAHLRQMGTFDKFESYVEGVLSGSEEYTSIQVNALIAREPNLFRHQIQLRGPIARTLGERAYDFVGALATVSQLAVLAGFRGLVVTIDEFEVESNLDRSKVQRAADVLNALRRYVSGMHAVLTPSPLAIFFGTVGEQTHALESIVDDAVEGCGGGAFSLGTWDREHRIALAGRIHNLYCRSYGLNERFNPAIAHQVETILEKKGLDDSGLIRQFIKWNVALLDMLHGPPAVAKR